MSAAHDEYEEDQAWTDGDERPLAPSRNLALAFLSTVPLFVAYEWARISAGGGLRSSSEVFVGRVLAIFGQYEDAVRFGLLGVLMAVALFYVRRGHWRLGHSIFRTLAEGLVGAILLGPLIVLGTTLLGDSVGEISLSSGPPADLPDLARTALIFGASAWEELLFRVGLYSLLYVIARRTLSFFGANDFVARWTGEAIGWSGSAVFFAAVHLESVVSFLGSGGEPYHSGLFAWRTLAGLFLGLLYRWRGAGVAAWAHGLFNVALLLGAGPGVFV